MSTPKRSQHKIRRFNPPIAGPQSNGTGKPALRGPSYGYVGTSQATAGGMGTPGPGVGVGGDGEWFGWEVQWRNPQAKKHKTWENDGYFVLNGTKGTLRDEDGKIIGTGMVGTVPDTGDEIKLAGKDILLDSGITRAKANQLFGSGPGGAIPPSPAAAAAAYAAATARSTPQPSARPATAIPAATPFHQKLAAQARPQVASPLAKEAVNMEFDEDEEAVRPAKKRRGPERDEARLSTTPVAGPEREGSAEGGKDLDSYLEQEDPISFTTSDFDLQPAPPPPPIVKPKPTKPAFTGLKPSAPPKSNELDEVDEEAYYYTGQYRKPQAKKHKTWDGDGVLVVQGRKATLYHGDNGQQLSMGRTNGKPFEVGDLVHVGSKEMEIDGTIDERFFNSGECFTKGFVPSAAIPRGARPPHQVPARPSAAPPPSLEPPSAPAPRTKFKPLQPSAPQDALAALTAPITNGSFYKPTTSSVPVPGSHSHGHKPIEPRHDPKAPGAVVLPRPNGPALVRHRKQKEDVVDVVVDPVLSRALRPHQIEGVEFLYEAVMGMRLEGQGCILADEMGLGKTVQAITLIYTLLKQSPFATTSHKQMIQRAVIACPVTLCQNWRNEIVKWLGRDRIQVVVGTNEQVVSQWRMSRSSQVLIIGYERLSSMAEMLQSKASNAPVGLIICDEGHRLKGKQSQINKALNAFTECKMRVILSGTPVQNNLTEFHTMVEWICPGILGDYKSFKSMYETPILQSRAPDATKKQQRLGQDRSEALNKLSSKFMLRRTADVIAKFLPPKLEYTVLVIPTPLETKLHAAILGSAIVKDITEGFGGQKQLALLTLLRKLCNTPGLIYKAHKEGKQADILTDKVMRLYPAGQDPNDFALSGKMMMLGALLMRLYNGKGGAARKRARGRSDEVADEQDEEDDGVPKGREKIVVVSNFTSTLDVVEAHCTKKGYTYCRLDGTTNQADRVKMVSDFNKGNDAQSFIFLLSSKSGGVGLNIIGASRLVLIDSDWNPSNDLQAMARIHREGQKRQCVIYRLLTSGTMDEKVFQRQVTKLGLAGSVMSRANSDQGGAQSGAGSAAEMGAGGAKGKGGGDSFTYEELKAVFTLHKNTACQTHDLLGCKCVFGEAQLGQGEVGAGEDENEEEPFGTFAPASQMPDVPEDNPAEAARKLSVLQDWVHHDGSSEASIDLIEDSLLRDVIYYQVAMLASKGGEGFKTEQFRRWEEEGAEKVDGKGMMELKGGMVGFAFARRSAGEEAA